MKRHLIFVAFILSASLLLAQEASKSTHRIAIRWNALGLVRHYAIGEVEYSISKRAGIFVGGGTRSSQVMLSQYDYNPKGWGVSAGARINLPIDRFTGLSLKGTLAFAKFYGQDVFGSYGIVWDPQWYYFTQYKIGGYGSIAYAQAFAKRFFVEPCIGIGPSFYQTHQPGARFKYWGLTTPMQLNLGVRF